MLTFWVLFNLFVLIVLAIDLGLFHRGPRQVTFKQAAAWTVIWMCLAGAFAVFVYLWQGRPPAVEFVTGYLIEQSLSADNLFVFLVLFTFFNVPREHQYKVLFWGIVGALVMRGAFILAGVALINRFHWIIYLFGALLIYSGVQLALQPEKSVEPEKNPVLKLLRRWLPMTQQYRADRFFVKENGRLLATPLLAVLVVVETTDLIFAVDSIPAVLAITRDPFIVYTSNVFAILGLRSMYFALAGMMQLFRYLSYGLAAILVFVGLKMLLSNETLSIGGFPLHYEMPTTVALGVVGALLLLSIAASVLFPAKPEQQSQ